MNLCVRKFQVDTQRAGWWGIRIPTGATDISVLQDVQTGSGAQ